MGEVIFVSMQEIYSDIDKEIDFIRSLKVSPVRTDVILSNNKISKTNKISFKSRIKNIIKKLLGPMWPKIKRILKR